MSPKRSVTRELLVLIVVALVLAFLIRTFVFESYQVEGTSMLNTVHNGDRVLVSKLAFRLGQPHTGEVIVFKSPVSPGQDWIKRVIGVPGETVSVKHNVVYLNGKRYPEPFLTYRKSVNIPPLKVPPGYVWVEGDNRPHSFDSRSFGFLPEANVRGRAILVWWSPADFKWLP